MGETQANVDAKSSYFCRSCCLAGACTRTHTCTLTVGRPPAHTHWKGELFAFNTWQAGRPRGARRSHDSGSGFNQGAHWPTKLHLVKPLHIPSPMHMCMPTVKSPPSFDVVSVCESCVFVCADSNNDLGNGPNKRQRIEGGECDAVAPLDYSQPPFLNTQITTGRS